MIHTNLQSAEHAAFEVPDILLAPMIMECTSSDVLTSDQVSNCTSPTPSTAASVTESELSDGLIDATLAQAAISAVETGTLTPLIKEELRCAIQSKRLGEGKGELLIENTISPKKRKLSAVEEERAKRRRERNKVAAQKCRGRKRELAEQLTEETVCLESLNSELRCQIDILNEEKEKLMKMLRRHDKSTQCDSKQLKLATL